MQRWGVDYWETYSPVVKWISVRLLFSLSLILKLESRSINFVLVFPQADLDEDIYMELPFGFNSNRQRTHVLKLNKSLYGLKQSSSNWFKFLTQSLVDRSFIPSKIDPYFYYKETCIILIYVDDCIVFSKIKSVIDYFVGSLQSGKNIYIH